MSNSLHGARLFYSIPFRMSNDENAARIYLCTVGTIQLCSHLDGTEEVWAIPDDPYLPHCPLSPAVVTAIKEHTKHGRIQFALYSHELPEHYFKDEELPVFNPMMGEIYTHQDGLLGIREHLDRLLQEDL